MKYLKTYNQLFEALNSYINTNEFKKAIITTGSGNVIKLERQFYINRFGQIKDYKGKFLEYSYPNNNGVPHILITDNGKRYKVNILRIIGYTFSNEIMDRTGEDYIEIFTSKEHPDIKYTGFFVNSRNKMCYRYIINKNSQIKFNTNTFIAPPKPIKRKDMENSPYVFRFIDSTKGVYPENIEKVYMQLILAEASKESINKRKNIDSSYNAAVFNHNIMSFFFDKNLDIRLKKYVEYKKQELIDQDLTESEISNILSPDKLNDLIVKDFIEDLENKMLFKNLLLKYNFHNAVLKDIIDKLPYLSNEAKEYYKNIGSKFKKEFFTDDYSLRKLIEEYKYFKSYDRVAQIYNTSAMSIKRTLYKIAEKMPQYNFTLEDIEKSAILANKMTSKQREQLKSDLEYYIQNKKFPK